MIGLSVDPVDRHAGWAKDIEETQGTAPNFPMIGDPDLKVSKLYDMLPAAAGDPSEGRTAADNQTVRTVYVIGPDKKIKLMLAYPMSTGRNFDEILRVVDSMQLTAKHKVATPANWKHGEDVIISRLGVSNDDAKKIWPAGWKEPKPYIRIVPQPRLSASASGSDVIDGALRRAPFSCLSGLTGTGSRVPSSTRQVSGPPKTAPVSMLMRFGRTSGAVAGVWPWTTTTPWSLSSSRNSSRIQIRSCGSCRSSGTPGRIPAWTKK